MRLAPCALPPVFLRYVDLHADGPAHVAGLVAGGLVIRVFFLDDGFDRIGYFLPGAVAGYPKGEGDEGFQAAESILSPFFLNFMDFLRQFLFRLQRVEFLQLLPPESIRDIQGISVLQTYPADEMP